MRVSTGSCARALFDSGPGNSSHLAGRTRCHVSQVRRGPFFLQHSCSPRGQALTRHAVGNDIFIDTTLPFGLRSSPKIFTTVADALEWVFLHGGVSWCTHYIHDFLTVGKPESAKCRNNLEVILE